MPEGMSGASAELQLAHQKCASIPPIEAQRYDTLGGLIDELEDLQDVAAQLVARLQGVKTTLSNMAALGQSDEGVHAMVEEVCARAAPQLNIPSSHAQGTRLEILNLLAQSTRTQDEIENTYGYVSEAVDGMTRLLSSEAFTRLLASVIASREPVRHTQEFANRTEQGLSSLIRHLEK